jgi:lipopolysaccharide/colanic/teichoic acid biosynthesis glycosyltransferase
LRESSLDELPQLWNVLKGDMSLVGPRPDEEIALQLYSQSDRAKLSMRPGITGLAMVSGRNRLAWQRRIELDIEYCTKFSLWLDVIIIIKTVKILIFREGIYSS